MISHFQRIHQKLIFKKFYIQQYFNKSLKYKKFELILIENKCYLYIYSYI